MVYKGYIVKLEKDFAVVLTNTMEYLKVAKKDGLMVGKEILFVQEDIYTENAFYYRKIAMAAVLFMVIISMSLFNKINITNNIGYGAVAVVSIDINPSLELQIDKANKVIKAIPINQDAKELLTNEKILGKYVEDVVVILIDKANKENYLNDEEKSVLISTVILNDNKKDENIENKIEKKLKEEKKLENIDVFYVKGKKEDLKNAHKENVSIGKYEVFQKIKEKDNKVNLKNIKKMKVQEIIEKKLEKLNEEKKLKKDSNYKKIEHIKEQIKELNDKGEEKIREEIKELDNKKIEKKDKYKEKSVYKEENQKENKIDKIENIEKQENVEKEKNKEKNNKN